MLKFSTFVNTFALLYVVKIKHISGVLCTGGGALVGIWVGRLFSILGIWVGRLIYHFGIWVGRKNGIWVGRNFPKSVVTVIKPVTGVHHHSHARPSSYATVLRSHVWVQARSSDQNTGSSFSLTHPSHPTVDRALV
jgi:hypothetical protein